MTPSSRQATEPAPLTEHMPAEVDARLARLAPRPRTLADTGLSVTFVADLVAKHFLEAGTLTLPELASRLALSGRVLETVLSFLRSEAKIQLLGNPEGNGAFRFALTDRGRVAATDARMRDAYTGPAPVPLKDYTAVVRAQTVHDRAVTRDAMHAAFDDLVLGKGILDQLGPALNSGRAIFIYGPAGTGKTFITQRLARLFYSDVLVPHAIAINEATIAVFDPLLHRVIKPAAQSSELLLEDGHDPRYARCERPVLISGGELTADMLEVHLDPSSREYRAPLQLKANNGLFIIDDMGRQRVAPQTVLNRWIVPMEEQKDYLSLGAGRHFSVPFDVVLIFSTNLHPLDLADEAFLRRIGYKIELDYITEREYRRIWENACRERGIIFDPGVLEFAMRELHAKQQVPLLPCHPRDLLGMAVDQATYLQEPRRVTEEHLRWAWQSYFVALRPGHERGNGNTNIEVSL
jgi:hypothetical protein